MKPVAFTSIGFKASIVIILAMGVFFRFHNLEQKVYWHDEVYTSLRISGYNGDQVAEVLFNGQVIKPADLLYFQRLNPDRNWEDTWEVLKEHPEHPPVYYLLARFCSEVWGSSIATTRGLAAWFSLLVFPALYWLCWELFPYSRVGWIAIALISISPFHVLYAQEARQYSLWTLTTVLACAAFLHALKSRKPKLFDWLLYSFTLCLNFYASLLSLFVMFAHFLYLLWTEKLSRKKVIVFFLCACGLSLLGFLPWLVVLWQNSTQVHTKTDWMNISDPWSFRYLLWELHLSAIWLDFPTKINHFLAPRISLLLLGAIIYTSYFIRQKTSNKQGLFLLLLILIPSLALILPDLILGGRRSSMTRYFIPSFLGIQITVSYWLAFSRLHKVKLLIATLIISLGILSCSLSDQAETWWNKLSSYDNPRVAQVINASAHPLVISDNYQINTGNLISLSYLLDEKVDLLLCQNSQIEQVPDGYSDVFFYNPSPELVSKLDGNLKIVNELTGIINLGNPNIIFIWQPKI